MVFQDVKIGDGWYATFAVDGVNEKLLTSFMAVSADGLEHVSTTHGLGSQAWNRVVHLIERWIDATPDLVAHHAANLREVRGRRALHQAVAAAAVVPAEGC